MPGLVRKSLDSPEETRPFEGGTGQLQLVNTQEGVVGRATFSPGWKWSEHVKPIAGTDSCQVSHVGYVVSGSLVIQTADGGQHRVKAGDFYTIPPGHDAWNNGDEDYVGLEVLSAAEYAKSG